MRPEDLRELLKQPEGLKLDFKREYKFLKPRPDGTDKQQWNLYVQGQWDEFIKDILALTNGNVGVANQTAYLIIGVGDKLSPDGTRELFDTSDMVFNNKQIVAKVNQACSPAIPDIRVNRVEIEGKTITVIEIPPSPHLHETTRDLEIPKAYFDENDSLRHVDRSSKTVYTKNTVFIRWNEEIQSASQSDRQALADEKKHLFVQTREKGFLGELAETIQANIVLSVLIFVFVTMIPTIWFYKEEIAPLFQQQTMTGEFNVAVAEFSVLGQDGSPIKSQDGQEMARFLRNRMESSFDELDLSTINYQLWGPEKTKQIKGDTPEERAQAAAEAAQKIGAHVLMYGVITTGDQPKFKPAFYVNYEGFDQAAEITGQHELGNPLRIVLPFEASKIQDIENPALSARANALSLITIGLAYYSIDEMDMALDYYHQAEALDGWLRNAGKEVVHLLIGNATMRKSSMLKSMQGLDDALEAFEVALEINPKYARARVGQAGVLYLLALGDPSNPSFETVDLDKLAQAEAAYQSALELEPFPESANIPEKVNFGLGQIYFVQSQATGRDLYSKAISAFEQVVHEYESGNHQIVDHACHAYVRLGLIYHLKHEHDLAIDYYNKAIKIASPFYQAAYLATLGELQLAAGKKSEAINAYEEAIQIAEFYGNEEQVNQYMQRLEELK